MNGELTFVIRRAPTTTTAPTGRLGDLGLLRSPAYSGNGEGESRVGVDLDCHHGHLLPDLRSDFGHDLPDGRAHSLLGDGGPFWARIRNGLLVSAGLTVSMAIGVLVAPFEWAIVPASVVIIVVVAMIYYTFVLTRGPSPVMMFYAAVLGTFFGSDPVLGWSMVGVTLFASLLTSVFLLVPLAFGSRRPERRAIAAARAAVDAYRDTHAVAEADRRLTRDAAHRAVSDAWLTLESSWSADSGPRYRELVDELTDINRDLAQTVLSADDAGPTLTSGQPTLPLLGRPSWRFLLTHAVHRHSVEWFTSWRMAVAAGISGIISELVGIGHPYWAILTATIVINQWHDRRVATRRAAHRAVGTLLGVGVFWAVSAFEPTAWWTVVAVLVCMIGQYILLSMNYAIGLIFITPMALLSVEASGTGGTIASISFDRFIDTIIGAGVALALTWATSRYFPRRLVRAQSARTNAAAILTETANRDGDAFSTEGRDARTALQYELIHHLSILDRAVVDDPRLADLAATEHEVADRSYAALNGAWVDAGKSDGGR